MHSKQSSVSTARTNSVQIDNRQQFSRIQSQLAHTKQQLHRNKREMAMILSQNAQLRNRIKSMNTDNFVLECEQEIIRLRNLVNDLIDSKSSGASEREQIKDRIIMKLEDELIYAKIALKQSKLKQKV